MKSIYWRPYFPIVIILNSLYLYIFHPYLFLGEPISQPQPIIQLHLIDFASAANGAQIVSHSKTYNYAKRMYFMMIPLIYLSPNEPDKLLERPLEMLKEDDCWLMEGNNGYFEIELKQLIRIHSIEYHHFKQPDDGFSDATPDLVTIEGLGENNNTFTLERFEEFENLIQRNVYDELPVASHVKVYVHRNFGHSLYTTLCRFVINGVEY